MLVDHQAPNVPGEVKVTVYGAPVQYTNPALWLAVKVVAEMIEVTNLFTANVPEVVIVPPDKPVPAVTPVTAVVY